MQLRNVKTSTRKRKLDSTSTVTKTSQDVQPAKKAPKIKHEERQRVEAPLPGTPQTLASDGPMDSDDEVVSMTSSVELEMVDDDSSVGFGAGE